MTRVASVSSGDRMTVLINDAMYPIDKLAQNPIFLLPTQPLNLRVASDTSRKVNDARMNVRGVGCVVHVSWIGDLVNIYV